MQNRFQTGFRIVIGNFGMRDALYGIMTNETTGQIPPATTAHVSHMWEVLCHAISFVGLGGIIMFGNVLGPLIVWLMKKSENPAVDAHGKESLNFQISMSIWGLACIPLCFLLIGIPLVTAVLIANVVLTIIASVKASNGEFYRYPLTIRFIK